MRVHTLGRLSFLFVMVLVLLCPVPASAQTSVDGEWSATFSFNNIEAIHTIMLPTGKIMFWEYSAASAGLWDPVTDTFSDMPNPNVNIFCAGHAWLPDGRLMVIGGQETTDPFGEEEANIYDPWTNTWANNVPAMNATNGLSDDDASRWYPSVTTLGNGDILTLSGHRINYQDTNPLPQVYDVETNTWRDLTSAVQTDLPAYPRTFLAPDGRVLMVSDYGNNTQLLDTTGTGSWQVIDQTPDGGLHNYGPAVMYDAGKIATFGGGDSPTANVSLIDLNDANPSWTTQVDTMDQPRRQNDATILADGTVLITGGSSAAGFNDPAGAIAETEIWDPETGQVSPLADADVNVFRGYHSTATLLLDGRVLITGGNSEAGTNSNAQIYSPAYLFDGNGDPADRPEVTNLPASVEYGDTFFVETPDASNIDKAIWIVPGATTHSQNWTQRANHLDFTETVGGLNITVPSNPNEAPPGYYMLFLVDNNGVPSVAEWLLAELPTTPVYEADFDGDGDVDSDDLTHPTLGWEVRYGNDLDGNDFLVWQQQFGSGVGAVSSSVAVPEPVAGLLLSLGFMGYLRCGRHFSKPRNR